MAASNSPPVGLSHPTVDPNPEAPESADARSGRCECVDCEYAVELADGVPSTCPECGGALTFVRP